MKTNNTVIYIHKNKINGKFYVGKTKQKVSRRWRNGKGYKSNLFFYRAIQKYGWDNFEHVILLENLSEEQANIKEIYYIKLLRSNNPKYGYNLAEGGSGNRGVIASKETREKIGRNSIDRGNPIIFNGVYFPTIRKLSKYLNVSYYALIKWLNHNVLPPKWFADNEIFYKGKIQNYQSLTCQEKKELKSQHIKDSLKRMNILGENHPSYKNGKYVGKKYKGIYYTPGHGNKGYKWTEEQKLKKMKKVAQLSMEGETIKIYNSLTEASVQTGFSISGISSCCNGRIKHFHHFKWKFV